MIVYINLFIALAFSFVCLCLAKIITEYIKLNKRIAMKRRCVNCKYGYNPVLGSNCDVQSCGFGLKDGAVPIGKFCPMDGKKLQNLRKGYE